MATMKKADPGSESGFLKDQLLIAMPNMMDPNFSQGVTYLFEHNENGAMGIVINRPAGLSLGEVFSQMEINPADEALAKQPVFLGGPVQTERGFVLHTPEKTWESTHPTSNDIRLTVSRDILDSIAQGDGPADYVVALGYAGWAAGQLEEEFKNNAWLNTAANSEIIFRTPVAKRWKESASLMGIDLDKLSLISGNA